VDVVVVLLLLVGLGVGDGVAEGEGLQAVHGIAEDVGRGTQHHTHEAAHIEALTRKHHLASGQNSPCT
jgi:hypothetical protein